uniref:Uncharacterized protein n=1 Tax=Peronospora matthiolae TaxID=2874970 RepID=A0AAV1V7U1_9STRA
MRCDTEAAKKAVARMRAAKESTSQASAAGDCSPAVASEQQTVPVVTSPRDESPRVKNTNSASALDATTYKADEPEIGIIYSGESDHTPDSKAEPPASR